MGVSVDSGNKKGRKTVDAELNLIPFIDLLSVCILFLLMTAVWVQISKMSAFSQPSGQAVVHHSEMSSINERRENREMDILVRKEGIQVVQDGKTIGVYAPADFRATILAMAPKLTAVVANPKISLRAEDQIVYDEVIQVLDALFAAKLMNVTVGGMS